MEGRGGGKERMEQTPDCGSWMGLEERRREGGLVAMTMAVAVGVACFLRLERRRIPERMLRLERSSTNACLMSSSTSSFCSFHEKDLVKTIAWTYVEYITRSKEGVFQLERCHPETTSSGVVFDEASFKGKFVLCLFHPYVIQAQSYILQYSRVSL